MTDGAFPSTCWSQIRDGADGDSAHAQSALERLIHAYWIPIQTYLKACGHRAQDVEDLTSGFFTWMLESELLKRADADKGRFRAFVKTAVRHYVIDRARESNAQKRGGHFSQISLQNLESPIAEKASLPPDTILDQAWRAELTRQGLVRLEQELQAKNRGKMFDVFRDYFLQPEEGTTYRQLADKHGLSTTDVSNFLTRAKRTYRKHLRRLVLETVHTEDELEQEWQWLFEEAEA